jgi:hypothetical protein
MDDNWTLKPLNIFLEKSLGQFTSGSLSNVKL